MSLSDTSLILNRPRQIAYFAASLKVLPDAYNKLDTNRLTLVHFAVHALDLLGVWESEELMASQNLNKQEIIDWIYSLQLPEIKSGEEHVNDKDDNNTDPDAVHSSGFFGGTFLGGSCLDEENPPPSHYRYGHIAMMYTALCTLHCLGDDMSRLDRAGILRELGRLQLPDGSFSCIQAGSESDLRFLYCACAISHMMNDWSSVNQDLAVDFIKACRSFDGGIAVLPGQEGHGGGAFCGVASLQLMNKLDDTSVVDKAWRKDLIRWCVHRQVLGMQGRPNKAQDTCYSYWIGGTLRLLGKDELLQHKELQAFVMKCQTKMGGFSKVLEAYPDLLHSYYSLSYLSLSQTHFRDVEGYEPMGLKELNCTLGIGMDRAALFKPLFP
jgi:geranylgeranyl transferase type-1 subunit beta